MSFAFIFPGHGSEMAVMLDSLSSRQEVKDTLQEASDILGRDFNKIIEEGLQTSFSLLPTAAPAMLTAGVAGFRAWQASGGQQPSIVAGHSHGEYSALVASGVLSFKDALEAVQYRATLMQAIKGSMAAVIGLSAVKVLELCANIRDETGKVVEAINFNAPGQILISGDKEAVESAIIAADAAGAKITRRLGLAVPAHSSLLRPVSTKLHEYFQQIEFRTPLIPIINNVDVAVLTNPIDIKDAMARQVSRPVRWQKIIESMSSQGIKQVVQCGPGNVLHELTIRIDKNLHSMAIVDELTLNEVLRTLNT